MKSAPGMVVLDVQIISRSAVFKFARTRGTEEKLKETGHAQVSEEFRSSNVGYLCAAGLDEFFPPRGVNQVA